MKQDERCACALFLIMNTYTVDLDEAARLRVRHSAPDVVKGNICGTRKPKNCERNHGDHHEGQRELHNLEHQNLHCGLLVATSTCNPNEDLLSVLKQGI